MGKLKIIIEEIGTDGDLTLDLGGNINSSTLQKAFAAWFREDIEVKTIIAQAIIDSNEETDRLKVFKQPKN